MTYNCPYLKERFNAYEDREYYCEIGGFACNPPIGKKRIEECMKRQEEDLKERWEQ